MVSGAELNWPAPAKLNRFLRIVGRRNDGYHCLQTAFQFLDWCDWLDFELTDTPHIDCVEPLPGVDSDQHLAVRAARLLAQAAGIKTGVRIHMRKTLPIGGGLGGGSSDAATVLVALNSLWSCGFAADRLAALGLQLGADVPVFVHGRAAWAEGVGERLHPHEFNRPWFLLVVPPVVVSTAEIFSDSRLTRDSEPIKMRAQLDDLGNDCEAVVYRRYPLIHRIARWLSRYTSPRLTGTGACLFGAFGSINDARKAQSELPKAFACRTFVGQGLNVSRLHDRLQKARIAIGN